MIEDRTKPKYSTDMPGVADLIRDLAADTFTAKLAEHLSAVFTEHGSDGMSCKTCYPSDVPFPCGWYDSAQQLALAWLMMKVTGV